MSLHSDENDEILDTIESHVNAMLEDANGIQSILIKTNSPQNKKATVMDESSFHGFPNLFESSKSCDGSDWSKIGSFNASETPMSSDDSSNLPNAIDKM